MVLFLRKVKFSLGHRVYAKNFFIILIKIERTLIWTSQLDNKQWLWQQLIRNINLILKIWKTNPQNLDQFNRNIN